MCHRLLEYSTFAETVINTFNLNNVKNMTDEKWRLIPGFEDYKVSTIGNGTSLNYHNTGQEHPIKKNKKPKGHLMFQLYKDKKKYCMFVHRAVALAFIPIPEKYKGIPVEKLDVHHINFIPWDNRVENLMWLTHSEHLALHKSERLYRYGIDGQFIDVWDSASEVERVLGINQAVVRRCIKGQNETAGDYQFSKGKHDRIPPVKSHYEKLGQSSKRSVVLFNLDGTKDSEHDSIKSAAKYLGKHSSTVSDCLRGRTKTVGGYIARYK